jgi:hypothetical protein
LAYSFYTGGKRDRDDGIALDHVLRYKVPGSGSPLPKKPYDWWKAHGTLVAITALLVAFVIIFAPGAS